MCTYIYKIIYIQDYICMYVRAYIYIYIYIHVCVHHYISLYTIYPQATGCLFQKKAQLRPLLPHLVGRSVSVGHAARCPSSWAATRRRRAPVTWMVHAHSDGSFCSCLKRISIYICWYISQYQNNKNCVFVCIYIYIYR